MMRVCVLFISVILSFTFIAGGVQQGRAMQTSQPATDEQAKILGLIRTIGTLEFSDYSESGTYESWPVLMKRHSKELSSWLSRNGFAQDSFANQREILPGWKLELNVNSDSHNGYLLLMENTRDKEGFAYVSDGKVIRESKYVK